MNNTHTSNLPEFDFYISANKESAAAQEVVPKKESNANPVLPAFKISDVIVTSITKSLSARHCAFVD
jgi:hypothetical protein